MQYKCTENEREYEITSLFFIAPTRNEHYDNYFLLLLFHLHDRYPVTGVSVGSFLYHSVLYTITDTYDQKRESFIISLKYDSIKL